MKGHGREEEELHKRRRDDWGWKLFGFPMGTRGLAMHHPYNRVSLRGGKQLPLPGGLRGRHRSWRGPALALVAAGVLVFVWSHLLKAPRHAASDAPHGRLGRVGAQPGGRGGEAAPRRPGQDEAAFREQGQHIPEEDTVGKGFRTRGIEEEVAREAEKLEALGPLAGFETCLVVDWKAVGTDRMLYGNIAALVRALSLEYKAVHLLIAAAECDVDGLGAASSSCNTEASEALQGTLQNEKVDLHWLPKSDVHLDFSEPLRQSYQTYRWLAAGAVECRVAHFLSPWLAHFAASARRQGVALKRTGVVAHFLATIDGTHALSRTQMRSVEELERQFMEAAAASRADRVLCQDEEVCEELSRQVGRTLVNLQGLQVKTAGGVAEAAVDTSGFAKPEASVLPLPSFPIQVQRPRRGEKYRFAEIVFVGDIHVKNGLDTFCDAVAHLADVLAGTMHLNRIKRVKVNLTFLGKNVPMEDTFVHSEVARALDGMAYVKGRLAEWASSSLVTVNADFKQLEYAEWMAFLGTPAVLKSEHGKEMHRLAVVCGKGGSSGASRAVTELVSRGLPFFAHEATVKPLKEFSAGNLDYLGFKDARDLAVKLADALTHGLDPVGRLESINRLQSNVFLREHRQLPAGFPASVQIHSQSQFSPLVSVCIVAHDRPALLLQAVQSVAEQDYPDMELIIVDNGSPRREEMEALGAEIQSLVQSYSDAHPGKEMLLTRMRTERTSLSAARNRAAFSSHGEYILFMDDDNLANPHEVSTLVRAAVNTNAGVVTSANDYFRGGALPGSDYRPVGRWLPLGGAVAVGMFRDAFGDANALVHRGAFTVCGGFQDEALRQEAASTGEDWELFARAALKGYAVEVVPEPLFWYRQSPDSLGHTTSRSLYFRRVLRPYLEAVPEAMHPALQVTQQMYQDAQRTGDGGSLLTLLANIRKENKHCSMMAKPDIAQDFKRVNLVANPRFEEVDAEDPGKFRHWGTYGDGYELGEADGELNEGSGGGGRRLQGQAAFMSKAEHEKRFGKAGGGAARAKRGLVIRAATADRVAGAEQTVQLSQDSPQPLFLAASCSGESVEGPGGDGFSIYLDLTYKDGSNAYGFYVPFAGLLGKGGGREAVTAALIPQKAVEVVRLYLLFRKHSGRVRFESVTLRPLEVEEICSAANPFVTLDAASGPAFSADSAVLL